MYPDLVSNLAVHEAVLNQPSHLGQGTLSFELTQVRAFTWAQFQERINMALLQAFPQPLSLLRRSPGLFNHKSALNINLIPFLLYNLNHTSFSKYQHYHAMISPDWWKNSFFSVSNSLCLSFSLECCPLVRTHTHFWESYLPWVLNLNNHFPRNPGAETVICPQVLIPFPFWLSWIHIVFPSLPCC